MREDLGEYETTTIRKDWRSAGFSDVTIRVHVIHVTDSAEPERCRRCLRPLPRGSEFYVVRIESICPDCWARVSAAYKPAPGFKPERVYGPAPEWWHRRPARRRGRMRV